MKYAILICCFLLIFCCGCLQTNVQQPVSKPVVTPTPIPAPIVGTWEGTVDLLAMSAPLPTYRITFSPYHSFEAKPLTSGGSQFSGTWNQCITDVECLPSEMMYQAGLKYTTDNYVIQVNVKILGQPTTIKDIVSLKSDTLDYRGTQHRV